MHVFIALDLVDRLAYQELTWTRVLCSTCVSDVLICVYVCVLPRAHSVPTSVYSCTIGPDQWAASGSCGLCRHPLPGPGPGPRLGLGPRAGLVRSNVWLALRVQEELKKAQTRNVRKSSWLYLGPDLASKEEPNTQASVAKACMHRLPLPRLDFDFI